MPDVPTLLLFAAASFVLIVIPGPAVVFIVTRSVEHGRRAGLVSMLGVEAGALVHVAAAAVGLSALLTSSAVAFTVVKYAGAAYLVVLGIQALRRRATDGHAVAAAPPSRGRLFRQGVLVNALNPKVAVFFLAFLPQFVDPGGAPVALQIGVLGTVFVAVAILCDSSWAFAAGAAALRLRRSDVLRRRLDRVSGGVYLALGASAALTGERPQR